MNNKRIISSIFLISLIFLFSSPANLVESYKVISVESLQNYNEVLLPNGVVGPESIAFDCMGGGPYVGVSDGRILKWSNNYHAWNHFAFTAPNRPKKCNGSSDPKKEPICGRPLGLKFNNVTCDLFIADAYYGLLKVGIHGGTAQRLANSAGGVPFRLTNGLDVNSDSGVVYFTDSSTIYQRREHEKVIEQDDRSGRLLKYDPRTKTVTVLLHNIFMPNGISLNKNKSFILLAVTGDFQLLKFWLTGPKANTVEPFAQLARYPDNIKRNDDGEFWVALDTARELSVVEQDNNHNEIPWFERDPIAVKFREDGSVVELVDGNYGTRFDAVSEIMEFQGTLWVGSVVKPFLCNFKATGHY